MSRLIAIGDIHGRFSNWLKMNGGDQTLASYKRAGHFLKVHQEFYMNTPLSWETEQYFFCHAGVQPRVPLSKQRPIDMIEIREPFLLRKRKYDHSFRKEGH